MALKIEDLNGRVRLVVDAVVAEEKAKSPRDLALKKSLDPARLNTWINDAMPDWEGLLKMAAAFDVPWAWFLVGDAGARALSDFMSNGRRRFGPEPSSSRPKQEGETRRPKRRTG